MNGSNAVIACPHCFGKIELGATAPHIFPYSLSIICMTRGGETASRFIYSMAEAAQMLGAELIVGTDGNDILNVGGVRAFPILTEGYVEGGLNQLARHAQGRFVLRLDDDESISPAMLQWLKEKRYEGSAAWAFPTAALWGDHDHFITSPPFWPDAHVRLTAWHMAADWPDEPHGKPAWVRTARPAPVAILHHKFLIRTYAERKEIADRYESKLKGGGHGKRWVYNCPEDVLRQLMLSSVGDGPRSNIPQNTGEVVNVKEA